jgi:hypothetical protein
MLLYVGVKIIKTALLWPELTFGTSDRENTHQGR